MPATRLACNEFGKPVESSVYWFEHYRFDSVVLTIGEQRGRQLHVAADVEGDVDGIGIASLHADGWLDFECLIVALTEEPPSVESARAKLSSFTGAEGLEGVNTGHSYRFTPSAST